LIRLGGNNTKSIFGDVSPFWRQCVHSGSQKNSPFFSPDGYFGRGNLTGGDFGQLQIDQGQFGRVQIARGPKRVFRLSMGPTILPHDEY